MSLATVLLRNATDTVDTPRTLAVGSVLVPRAYDSENNVIPGAIGALPAPAYTFPTIDKENASLLYRFAIVVQVSPLVLASEDAMMRWTGLDESTFWNVGQANAATVELTSQRAAA